MRPNKRSLWKASITITSMLILLVFLVVVSVSVVNASEEMSASATPGSVTVQATPTVDATVTALNKEQLTLQVEQLQNQSNWVSNNSTSLIAAFATIVVALFGISQWAVNRRDERRKEKEAQDKELEDRKAERERREREQERWLVDQEAEREKHAEERFQAAVTALGDDQEGARIGAAILLRTFLIPGYERFYTQIFQLVVANLRLPRSSLSLTVSSSPLPLTALSQALIVAFMEAFPLAREQEKKNIEANFMPGTQTVYNDEYEVNLVLPASVLIASKEIHALSAVGIVLDNGFLWYADLKRAWMAQASLQKTDFTRADLRNANLYEANLSEAYLWKTNLSGASLWVANLSKADLRETNLSGAYLREANLSGAYLQRVNLQGADLREANLSGANLDGTILEDSLSLDGTDLRGVTGLTKKQLADSQIRGAII